MHEDPALPAPGSAPVEPIPGQLDIFELIAEAN